MAVLVFALAVLGVFATSYITSKTTTRTQSQAAADVPFTNRMPFKQALTISGRLMPQETPVTSVGAETLYNKDLNFILYTQFPQDFANTSLAADKLKALSLPIAIDQSVILQTAQSQGLITLTSDIFNNLNKDYVKRGKNVKSLTDKLSGGEEIISGGAISVWYHNVKLPSIPMDQARTLALSKITTVYDDFRAGKLTFQQACDQIKNDATLAQIDLSYQKNACVTFTDQSVSEPILLRDIFNKALLKLQPGQVSPILEYPPRKTKMQLSEEYFIFMTVFSRSNSGKGSFDEMLNSWKNNYAITIL